MNNVNQTPLARRPLRQRLFLKGRLGLLVDFGWRQRRPIGDGRITLPGRPAALGVQATPQA
jgi:hypothetical protein